ncbi:MAG: HD domain-containing phosphohydrolase [Planctomycetota bacterium]|nr:GAF domain-containing protein [Planctomycetota bacterium]MDW8373378.1 HD domain-containing phosphohydrolase [Planctomycetota bacterium]
MENEVAELRRRIAVLNRVGRALSSETDPRELCELILQAAMDLTRADGGTLYDVVEDRLRFVILHNQSMGLHAGVSGIRPVPLPDVPLRTADGRENHASVIAHCVLTGRTVNIADAYAAPGFDFSGTRAFDARTGYRTTSVLAVPMRDHEGVITGALQLINARDHLGTIVPFPAEDQELVESLASQAATARSRHQLIEDQKRLFESFIQLIATAIDEKSPHTGEHCRRVPELTMMLAEAAARDPRGALAGFRMDEKDRYELRIAAWLHDCGKITTPEWVMEKATKLTALFDRIELIATRFAAAAAQQPQLAAQLRADLEFLRQCNLGGETMRVEDQQRVREIAMRRWQALDGSTQPLLTDDEVENLCIARGTLLPREREIINNHIVATIRMLEALPFPRHLRRVPEFAGGHHERMDGKGYPRGLKREQMSVQARIMGIADIFEALTAADRPYKRPMKLSESLAILGRMALDGHIDPDLFDVFVRSGVWRAYAQRFLKPEQIDEVDLNRIPGFKP